MFADPSKLTPPMVLAFANAVAVAAFPVLDPDEPETLPVTLPVRFPMNVVAVVVPDTLTFCRKVAFVLVLILSVTAIPVSADPSFAGNVDGNLASGIVPELRFDAFKLDKLAPDPSDSNSVPAEFGKTTVGFPENCECGGACNLR